MRACELEVLQADRLDVLGLVGAVLGPGDLEAHGGPPPRLVCQAHVEARGVRAVLGRRAATKGEVAVRLGEGGVERVEQVAGFASENDIDVLRRARSRAHAQLDRHAALEQEQRLCIVGRCTLQGTEQGHRRDPAPHAIGGDAALAAVAADELLEVALDGPVSRRGAHRASAGVPAVAARSISACARVRTPRR